jgi:hypothetical protein
MTARQLRLLLIFLLQNSPVAPSALVIPFDALHCRRNGAARLQTTHERLRAMSPQLPSRGARKRDERTSLMAPTASPPSTVSALVPESLQPAKDMTSAPDSRRRSRCARRETCRPLKRPSELYEYGRSGAAGGVRWAAQRTRASHRGRSPSDRTAGRQYAYTWIETDVRRRAPRVS